MSTVGYSYQNLRFNVDQRDILESFFKALDGSEIGEIFMWQGQNGAKTCEIYSYDKDVKKTGNSYRRFHKFENKDQMLGWMKAISQLEQKTILDYLL